MPLRVVPPLHRATHRVGLVLDQPPALGVTQAEAHVLAQLASEGRCTISALQRGFGYKPSTLTSVLDRLETRGLVTRATNVRDRRTFDVRLTPRGRPLATRVLRRLERFERALAARVSDRDLLCFFRVLEAAADGQAAEGARRHPSSAPRRPRTA